MGSIQEDKLFTIWADLLIIWLHSADITIAPVSQPTELTISLMSTISST